jgi:hypothetical protein
MTNTRKGFTVKAAAVQDALATAIGTQQTAISDATPLSVGYPAGGLLAEHIWISGEFDVAMPRRASGGLQRDEEGTVEVRVSVVYSASVMATARDRAIAIAKIVENAVSVDPTLGGVVQEAHVASVAGAEAAPDEHSRQYGLVLRVVYQTTAVLA